MNWKHKATVMRICADLPGGEVVYKFLQKTTGRLTSDPTSRLKAQVKIARSLLDTGATIEGKTVFEVGTGHLPIVPIGFFLSGAESVVTVDLHRRLDLALFKKALLWIAANSEHVETIYADIAQPSTLQRRILLIRKFSSDPIGLLQEANIKYVAPADAASTLLAKESIDFHISNTVLEHIPKDDIIKIFGECKRILKPKGMALHAIDLSDHFQHQDRSITRVNYLRYSDEKWMKIAGNQFAYCNRLRASDYRKIFHDLAFRVIRTESDVDAESMISIKNGMALDDKFRAAEIEDLCTTYMYMMMQLA